jgi:hypothetical protein
MPTGGDRPPTGVPQQPLVRRGAPLLAVLDQEAHQGRGNLATSQEKTRPPTRISQGSGANSVIGAVGTSGPNGYAEVVMRTTLAYTSARILLLVVSIILLYLVGARGLLLLALACVVSGIASFVLLSRQRDRMSSALMARIRTGQRRAGGFRARLEEGARAEDDD